MALGAITRLLGVDRASILLFDDEGVMSAVIPAPAGPFGVLVVHSTRPRAFTPDDVQFLQGLTNVLGAAIGRFHGEAALRDSEARLAGIVSSAAVWGSASPW